MKEGDWQQNFGTKAMDDAIARGMETYTESL
jgi:hypothetical protein